MYLGGRGKGTQINPDTQVEQIRAGHHILPFFDFDKDSSPPDAYYESAMRQMAVWKLPFTLIATQWEQILYTESRFWLLPTELNPNLVDARGQLSKTIEPSGPVQPWIDAGREWGASNNLRRLEEWYPDPPLVIMLSNNEAHRLAFWDSENSQRYLSLYGLNRGEEFKRKVMGDGYIERYKAFLGEFRNSLNAPKWKANAKFVGFNIGSAGVGLLTFYWNYTLPSSGRIESWHLAWDGGSVADYWSPLDGDERVVCAQVSEMNNLLSQREAYRNNPKYWYEISIWDSFEGNTRKSYDTPALYRARIQFLMWTTCPRVVREYRDYGQVQEDVGPDYWGAVLAAVDAVYADPTLKRFWRKGALVANVAHASPFQNAIPEEIKELINQNRWFLLDVDVNAPWPWRLGSWQAKWQDGTAVKVLSLARVLGTKPTREWLVYAYSPAIGRSNVTITLPEFGDMRVDVPQAGAFYLVKEANRSVAHILLASH